MQRRLRRLLPLYALTCLIFIFVVRPEILSRPWDQVAAIIVSHALFLQNLSPQTHGAINGVTWSLALEMQFYVVLILSIKWLIRLGGIRTLLLLIGMAWAWRYATTLILLPGQAIAHLQVIYTTQLPGALDAFGVGIALALSIHQGSSFSRRWLNVGWRPFFFWLALSVMLLWSAAWQMGMHLSYWSYHGMVIFWRTLLALGFGAALAAVVTFPVKASWALRPVQYLGEISYGIYLWHFLILTSVVQLTKTRGEPLLIIVMTGSIVLAATSWHLMEKPWAQQRQA
jgi:peptidoglycan/LPS O-acetylase OafA/YrhL